jgi:hypothetical protein
MQIPGDDMAGILAGAGLVAAFAWKVWLRLRQDNRDDTAGSRQNESYGAIIAQLRLEVDRLGAAVNEISSELMHERTARRRAESLAVTLQGRVETLEQELAIFRKGF